MNLSHGTVVAICLGLVILVTLADILLEAFGHTNFDPQPLYVFLALVLGQQGAKASSKRKGSDADS